MGRQRDRAPAAPCVTPAFNTMLAEKINANKLHDGPAGRLIHAAVW
jgi:hypothetical protein